MTRAVTTLLRGAFAVLNSGEGEGRIQDVLLGVWEQSGRGDTVAAEALVALELASRDVMKTKRMSFARLEMTEPDKIKPLFEAAITITQTPKPKTPKPPIPKTSAS